MIKLGQQSAAFLSLIPMLMGLFLTLGMFTREGMNLSDKLGIRGRGLAMSNRACLV